MIIRGYRVETRTGALSNTSLVGTKAFHGDNPIHLRRQAHQYAGEIFDTIKEASDEGVIHLKTDNVLKDGVETFVLPIYCEFIDGNGEEDEIVVSGYFVQDMIQSWAFEAEIYIACDYDTGGAIYQMDCSKFSQAYVSVLRDVYEAWHEECGTSYGDED